MSVENQTGFRRTLRDDTLDVYVSDVCRIVRGQTLYIVVGPGRMCNVCIRRTFLLSKVLVVVHKVLCVEPRRRRISMSFTDQPALVPSSPEGTGMCAVLTTHWCPLPVQQRL